MNRGDIWWVDFSPQVGDEMNQVHAAVVVSDDNIGSLDLRVVVPITSWQSKFSSHPWKVRLTPDDLNGLTNDSAADAFQVKSISTKRFRKRIGFVSEQDLADILAAVAIVLGIQVGSRPESDNPS